MKYSARFTLEIPMPEFYKMAKPTVNKKALHKVIKRELYHCWMGIVNGHFGGESVDWKEVFYRKMWSQGWIHQTEESISIYGEFK